MCGHHTMQHATHGTPVQEHHNAMSMEDPKRVLQLRYARGEITREEYLQMMADLEGAKPQEQV